MTTFDFGTFIKILCSDGKKDSDVISISFNDVFDSIFRDAYILNREGNIFSFSPSSISRLKHHKDDVPEEMRKRILLAYEKGKLNANEVYNAFCHGFYSHNQIIAELKSQFDKNGLTRNKADLDQKFFLECIVEAVKPNNKLVPDKTRKKKTFWEWSDKEKDNMIRCFIDSHCHAHNVSFDGFNLEILKDIIYYTEYLFSDEEIYLLMKRFAAKTSNADHPQMTKEQILEEKLCLTEPSMNTFQAKRATLFLFELKKLELENKKQSLLTAYKKKDWEALSLEIKEIYNKKNYFSNSNLKQYLMNNSFFVPTNLSSQIPDHFASFIYEVGFLCGLWKIEQNYVSQLDPLRNIKFVEQYGYDTIIGHYLMEYYKGLQMCVM